MLTAEVAVLPAIESMSSEVVNLALVVVSAEVVGVSTVVRLVHVIISWVGGVLASYTTVL